MIVGIIALFSGIVERKGIDAGFIVLKSDLNRTGQSENQFEALF